MSKRKDPWNNIIKRNEIRKEAIKRNPLYHQEFEASFKSFRESLSPNIANNPYRDLIESFQLSNQGQKFCKRWGLAFALRPDDELWNIPVNHAPALFQDPGKAVKVIPHEKTKLIPISDEESHIDIASHLRNDRYLKVEIDLFDSKSQIMEEIAEKVDEYQELIIQKETLQRSKNQEGTQPPPASLAIGQWMAERNRQLVEKIEKIRYQLEREKKHRRRGKSLDINFDKNLPGGPVTIFQVWDMNKKGKSAWNITQELYPEIRGKSPNDYSDNYDKEAKRLLRSVERAIEEATNLIDSVTPT